MDNVNLKEWVNQISIQFFGKPYQDEVVINNRLRTTGGRYIPKERRIELNPKFLNELGEGEFIGIIKHELCHYHLHIEGKGYKHRDKDFRELLIQTDSPRHCSSLPSQKQKKQHAYMCTQCGNIYRRQRQINTKKYRCGNCKGILKKK